MRDMTPVWTLTNYTLTSFFILIDQNTYSFGQYMILFGNWIVLVRCVSYHIVMQLKPYIHKNLIVLLF